MSDKTFAWLAGSLIGCVAVLAVLIANMRAISAALPWLIGAIGLILLLVATYKAWHHMQVKKLEREKLAAEVALLENDRWVASQTLLGEWQVAEKKIELERELELERIRLEQMRAANEHTRLMAAAAWQQQHVLVPEGHTVVFRGEQLEPLTTIANPRTHAAIAAPKVNDLIAGQASMIYPEPLRFEDVLRSFQPGPKNIYLMKTVASSVQAAMEELCHVGLGGPTGGGKTNTTRLLIAQLLKVGAPVYFASPNFAQVKLNSTHIEDWRPIVARLAAPPAQSAEDIRKLLLHFKAGFEQRKRIEQTTIKRSPDVYLVLGELPGIVARVKEAPEILEILLREARQYGVHVITEFQDALTETIGSNSGVRENFRTGYYYGGDLITAKVLLDLPKGAKIDETGLGQKGAVYLRAWGQAAQPGRVPWFTNRALYMLLGTPPDPMTDDEITDMDQVPESYHPIVDGRYVDAPAAIEIERLQDPFLTRTPGVVEADPDTGETERVTRHTGPLSALSETTETTLQERDYPLMNAYQAAMFVAGYKLRPNVDEVLKTIDGVSTKHRQHARELIKQHNLDQYRESRRPGR